MSEREPLPPRLLEERSAAGDLLRRAGRARTPDTGAAWERLMPALVRPAWHAGLWSKLALSLVSLLAGAAVMLLLGRREPAAVVVRPAPVVAPAARAPVEPAPNLVLDASARSLPERAVDLRGLVGGRVAVASDRRLEILAPPYRLSARGTTFRVERRGRSLALVVETGQVSVHRDRRLLSVVSAGQTWSTPARAVRPPDLLAQELAAYEAGSARRDGGDLAGALQAFTECRHRFPRGMLRLEVDLSIVELLPRLGRFQQALDESAAILAAHPRGERTAELHKLRGNIYRDALHDPARAAEEYKLANKPAP